MASVGALRGPVGHGLVFVLKEKCFHYGKGRTHTPLHCPLPWSRWAGFKQSPAEDHLSSAALDPEPMGPKRPRMPHMA